MNTETLTTPSPELKQHLQDLRREADNVTQDIKKQASAGLQEIQTEANNRIQDAKGTAADLFSAVKDFAAQHPLKTFAAGIVVGFFLSKRRNH